MTVWRIHLKPAAIEGVDPFQFCIDRGIAGAGWLVDGGTDGISLEEYEAAYEAFLERTNAPTGDRQGWRAAINALGRDMQRDDLVWTRSGDGAYYLGRVTSGWLYCAGKEYSDADIVNVRKCEWHKVEDENIVPPEVVNSSQRQTVARVLDNEERVKVESQRIYNQVSKCNLYRIEA